MGYSLQTLSGFETFLHNQGFDNNTTTEITNYLAGLGYTSRVAQDIESSSTPTFDPHAQVDIAVNSSVTFTPATGSYTALLIDIGDSNIVVSATTPPVNVAVATNSGIDNTVTLNDYGNDQVFLGSGGNNTVYAGYGNDTIDGGITGNDYVYLYHSGNDSIKLSSGSGSDSVSDSGGGNDTVDLGSGPSTVDASSQTGGSLDVQTSTGSATISLGTVGSDSVGIATDGGAGVPGVTDTITALGNDTVSFDSSITSMHEYNISATTTVITFGGQLTLDNSNNYVPDPSNPPVQTVSITTNGGNVLVEFTDGHFKA